MQHIKTLDIDFQGTQTYPSLELRELETPLSFKTGIELAAPKLLGEDWQDEIEELNYFRRFIPGGVSISLPKSTQKASIEVFVGATLVSLTQDDPDEDQYIWPRSTQVLDFPLNLAREELFKINAFQVGIARSQDKEFLAKVELSVSEIRKAWDSDKYRNIQDLENLDLALPAKGYHVIFEAYRLNEHSIKGRLSFLMGESISFSTRVDSAFLFPGAPAFEELLPKVPHFRLKFGPDPQEIKSFSVRSSTEKINFLNVEAPPNHRYWNAKHHAQGFAWSPGTITLKATATLTGTYDARLEIFSAPQLPPVQSDSLRAVTLPFRVESASSKVVLQLPNQMPLLSLDMAAGDYTLLFECDIAIPPYHWCDLTRKHEETGILLDSPDEKSWDDSVDEAQRFSPRYRITIVPVALETVQILKADEALSKIRSMHLDLMGRAIADINGKTLPRARFTLVPSLTPSDKPITKFGGQPVWLERPQWPIARTDGKPMEFIGQIALDPQIFGDIPGKIAYIFTRAYDADAEQDFAAWDADSGDNAVVIQPGGTVPVRTKAMATGPSVKLDSEFKYGYKPVELFAELVYEEELFLESFSDSYSGFDCEVSDDWSIEKIGGTPVFIHLYSSGFSEKNNLILQLYTPDFSANVGDQTYVFLSENGRSGYMFSEVG